MTNTTSELERQTEQMVAALRKAAQGAVERAFAAAGASAPTVAPSRTRAARATSKRRAGAELSALGERFFEGAESQARSDNGGAFGRSRRVVSGVAPGGRSIAGGRTGQDRRRALCDAVLPACGERFELRSQTAAVPNGEGRGDVVARGTAAGGQEVEHALVLLACGVGDGH